MYGLFWAGMVLTIGFAAGDDQWRTRFLSKRQRRSFEIHPEWCSSRFCMGNGRCNMVEGRYNCSCFFGYAGERCQKRACTPNPCQNGVCSLTNTYPNYECKCDSAYVGSRCEARKYVTHRNCSYHFNVNDTMTSYSAIDVCKNLSGVLAIPDTYAIQTFISQQAHAFSTTYRTSFWIGGIRGNGDWTWTGGSEIQYDRMSCLITDSRMGGWIRNFTWETRYCNENHGYVCEVPDSDPCSSNPCGRGICNSTGCHFRCSCLNGYQGESCDDGGVNNTTTNATDNVGTVKPQTGLTTIGYAQANMTAEEDKSANVTVGAFSSAPQASGLPLTAVVIPVAALLFLVIVCGVIYGIRRHASSTNHKDKGLSIKPLDKPNVAPKAYENTVIAGSWEVEDVTVESDTYEQPIRTGETDQPHVYATVGNAAVYQNFRRTPQKYM